MRPFAHRLLIAALPLSLLSASISHASEVKLPGTMAWTARAWRHGSEKRWGHRSCLANSSRRRGLEAGHADAMQQFARTIPARF